jgi:hypothetical protein
MRAISEIPEGLITVMTEDSERWILRKSDRPKLSVESLAASRFRTVRSTTAVDVIDRKKLQALFTAALTVFAVSIQRGNFCAVRMRAKIRIVSFSNASDEPDKLPVRIRPFGFFANVVTALSCAHALSVLLPVLGPLGALFWRRTVRLALFRRSSSRHGVPQSTPISVT